MIPFIRSISELMAITESRMSEKNHTHNYESYISIMDSGQSKRYARSIEKKEINLPDIPKTIRRRWIQNKKYISRFIDELDYNNQIQTSYELTLLERQSKSNQQDVA